MRNILRAIVWLGILCAYGGGLATAAARPLQYTAELPYVIGGAAAATPAGGQFQGRICLLFTASAPQTAVVSLRLPGGFAPARLPPGWIYTEEAGGGALSLTHAFGGGYENWFELLQFTVRDDVAPGAYEILLTIAADGRTLRETRSVTVGPAIAAPERGGPAIAEVALPYDRERGADRRLDNGTLLLRDGALDYYKSLFIGRGAMNAAAESVHPLTHMGLRWVNPSQQPMLILLRARLLDPATRREVGGLVSPDGSLDEDGVNSGVDRLASPHLTVFAALTGAPEQWMEAPLYVDQAALRAGSYLMEITAEANGRRIAATTTPVRVVAHDAYAGVTTLLAALAVLCGLPYILARGRLQKMKSRHLITAGLFGATAFIAVNAPGTFFSDFFSILLGPFSFLVSGMFTGLLLYMLIGGLVVLLPHRGVVTLMLLVRMLISMLVFGHISPLVVLSYGTQAILLEIAFYALGITRGGAARPPLWTACLLALACGAADTVVTYVNLQAYSFLYRLFYADWYIALCMLVSGFVYPALGGACGSYLGRELKKVGVD